MSDIDTFVEITNVDTPIEKVPLPDGKTIIDRPRYLLYEARRTKILDKFQNGIESFVFVVREIHRLLSL